MNDDICRLYTEGYTMRHISEMLGTNHHYVKRVLVKNNIEITPRPTKKPYSEERRRNLSKKRKRRRVHRKNVETSRETLIKNMVNHLKYDVTEEWIDGFENLDKMKYLNHSLSRKRDYEGFDTEMYMAYIEKFYNDEKFNFLFDKWIATGDKYIKPSLDHIVPKSKGGALSLDNLRFISWFENKAKGDILLDDWLKMKDNIQMYL